MKINIKYDTEKEKAFVKIDNDDYKDIEFSLLLDLTNKVIDENIDLEVEFEGFEGAPDVGTNYKKLFDDISKLKTDKEIIDLKAKITKNSGNDQNSSDNHNDEESEDEDVEIEGI